MDEETYNEMMKQQNMESEEEVIRKLCREHGINEEEIFAKLKKKQ